MEIYNQLLPAESTISGWMLDKLSKSTLFSNDAEITQRVAAYAIRLLFVTPLLTLCAAADLTFWSLKTVCIYPVYVSGIYEHALELIRILVLPIFALAFAFADCLPTKQPTTVIVNRQPPPPAPVEVPAPAVENRQQPPAHDAPPPARTEAPAPAIVNRQPPPAQPPAPEALPPPASAVDVAPPPAILQPAPHLLNLSRLILAVETLDVKLVRQLLEANANPNRINNKSPLCELAKISPDNDIFDEQKMLAIATLLLDKGASVEGQSDSSPLNWSAWNGHLTLAKLLLDRGANPNSVSEDKKFNPLRSAIECFACSNERKLQMITLLLDHGAKPCLSLREIEKIPGISQLDVRIPKPTAYHWHQNTLHPQQQQIEINVAFKQKVMPLIARKMLSDDTIITEGHLKGCTPRAVAVAVLGSSDVGGEYHYDNLDYFCKAPFETEGLQDLWTLTNLLENAPAPEDRWGGDTTYSHHKHLREMMKKNFAHTDEVFYNPYLQAFLQTFKSVGYHTRITTPSVFKNIRRWMEQVTKETQRLTVTELDTFFAAHVPDMSKDLSQLITSYVYAPFSTKPTPPTTT